LSKDGEGRMSQLLRTVWFCAGTLLAAQSVYGEPSTLVVNSGPASNRIDVVVLGDGYTAAQLGQYAADVNAFVLSMFGQEPLSRYASFFNVRRVDVVSAQSGADHPELGSFKDTALHATYNCANIQRLICVDVAAVYDVVARSVAADAQDIILVLVNDPEYGGSGGSVAVASTNVAAAEVVLHELGHSFGLLADEYSGGGPSCSAGVEPVEPNVTIATTPSGIKWNAWIAAATPVPTVSTQLSIPGLYEGGKYCFTGIYRPTYQSKMHTLGRPFDAINGEQLIRRMYNFVSPIDAAAPEVSEVPANANQTLDFSVMVVHPSRHALTINWTIDGLAAGTAAALSIQTSALTLGDHIVTVAVFDPTPHVRNDFEGLLKETRAWTVHVGATGLPDLTATSVLSPPSAGAPGSFFNTGDTVVNTGLATAAATTTRYYLSTDASKNVGDVLLTGTRAVPTLLGSEFSSGGLAVKIPTTAALGEYRLLACADDLFLVTESNEANNCIASAATILVALPDLRQISISVLAATAAPGASFVVTEAAHNGGIADASASTTRYLLSTDSVREAGDVLLTGTRSIPVLAAGATSTFDKTLTIPASAPLGTYRVIACVDDLLRVRETNETNNCLASATTIVVVQPDIEAVALSASPAGAGREARLQ
jgi:hypothetical protein